MDPTKFETDEERLQQEFFSNRGFASIRMGNNGEGSAFSDGFSVQFWVFKFDFQGS